MVAGLPPALMRRIRFECAVAIAFQLASLALFVALLRLRSATTAEALDEFCKARIGGYKRPRRYIFVEELPKSATGKILKAELRQLVRSGHFDPKESS